MLGCGPWMDHHVSRELEICGTDDVHEHLVAGQYVYGPLHLKCGSSRKFIVCDVDTTDQMHRCFWIVVKWVTMFLLHKE